MNVKKKACENGGYFITVEVGKRVWESYWSSPGESVDHAGLEYLENRYPIINTEKRAQDFKRQYKNLWITVTSYQLDLMKHCIGIGRKKRPYRNYFFTQETDKDWNELSQKGLAQKGEKHINNDEYVYFWLTKQGVEFTLGKSVSDKIYDEL